MSDPSRRPLAVAADDDPDILELVTFRLQLLGCDVAGARNGDEALRLVHAEKPDLVVLDVKMPQRDGFEVAQELRRSGETVPILMLTASASENDQLVGLDVGADAYLTKPFNADEFDETVGALLERRG